MKKTISITIIVLAVIAIGVGVYWFFDRQQQGGAGPSFNISNYLPFGKGSEEPTSTTPESGGGNGTNQTNSNTSGSGAVGGGNTSSGTGAPAQLWQISSDPQSGAVIFQSKTGKGSASSTYVRYLDRATGNVFESDLLSSTKKRISNTTIPKVYEALWQADGNSVVLRYTADNSSTIKSLYAKIVARAATATSTELTGENLDELRGTFLPADIESLSIEPGQTGAEKIFYLVPNETGGMSGFVASADGTKPALIFNSPLKQWLVSWPKKGTLALTTKPSGDIPGYLYFLDSKSGSFKKVLGDINGLTTLISPDASQVLYTNSGTNGMSLLGIYTIKTAAKQSLFKSSLPEKCVWGTVNKTAIYCAIPKSIPNGKYPDAWYQGLISFNDSIWKINTETGEAKMIIDPKNAAGVEMDATNLVLDAKENYLIFTNKKDYQLWGLKLLANIGT